MNHEENLESLVYPKHLLCCITNFGFIVVSKLKKFCLDNKIAFLCLLVALFKDVFANKTENYSVSCPRRDAFEYIKIKIIIDFTNCSRD